MSQCGPSLWPLDHSVINSPYTLLKVRTCCTLCEWRVPCRVRMIECWSRTHGSHSFVFLSTFLLQWPQCLKVSVPSALVPPLCWWLGGSLLCTSVSVSMTTVLYYHVLMAIIHHRTRQCGTVGSCMSWLNIISQLHTFFIHIKWLLHVYVCKYDLIGSLKQLRTSHSLYVCACHMCIQPCT